MFFVSNSGIYYVGPRVSNVPRVTGIRCCAISSCLCPDTIVCFRSDLALCLSVGPYGSRPQGNNCIQIPFGPCVALLKSFVVEVAKVFCLRAWAFCFFLNGLVGTHQVITMWAGHGQALNVYFPCPPMDRLGPNGVDPRKGSKSFLLGVWPF